MRDDYLASICVVDERGLDATLPLLVGMHKTLAQSFRYFEVVYVVGERLRQQINDWGSTLAFLPNLRILITDDSFNFYQQRAIAASEAIGDVVALVDLSDLYENALMVRLHEAKDRNVVLLGWRSVVTAGGVFYRLLSLLSRNVVTAQASRTIILSRERLNAILAQQHASLDLRFEPRSGPLRYGRFPLVGQAATRVSFGQRYELLIEILRAGAPRFLKIYAATGFAVAIGIGMFALYAIGVVLVKDRIQPGWFSNTIIISGSMGFISLGMSILAITLSEILGRIKGDQEPAAFDEIANTSFFDRLNDRNVEIHEERSNLSVSELLL